MKILIAGDWHSDLHEETMFRALIALEQQALRFAWHIYFDKNSRNYLSLIYARFQRKYMLGCTVDKINHDLIEKIEEEQPDILFIYRGTHIYQKTLQIIKKTNTRIKIFGYNNDDPFSTKYPKWQWRHFVKSIPEYDVLFAYRKHNLPELDAAGAKKSALLRSWFDPLRSYPVTLNQSEIQEYGCDVVFIGHYEDDERLDYLREIIRNGYKLKIWGPGYDWNPIIKKIPEFKHFPPIRLAWGEEYNKALCASKIALCFHSKLNRDTYTRRNFEIPASGTFMLSSYSEDLASLFAEGKEADYFTTKDELISKLNKYLSNDELRTNIAKMGREKVYSAKHDVKSRMQEILEFATS
ncbi:glycosyltransferase [Thiothrix sp.]|jgi:spore maturation protein CgeB|uniref:CgeB family protein n=1 Tax=Thiothrix sp. TaxID=1032 RepID=UPI00257D5A49|nr:glycosyltransferase [Thiothrix sp.]